MNFYIYKFETRQTTYNPIILMSVSLASTISNFNLIQCAFVCTTFMVDCAVNPFVELNPFLSYPQFSLDRDGDIHEGTFGKTIINKMYTYIKQSRVSYIIYDSRTFGPILMMSNFF